MAAIIDQPFGYTSVVAHHKSVIQTKASLSCSMQVCRLPIDSSSIRVGSFSYEPPQNSPVDAYSSWFEYRKTINLEPNKARIMASSETDSSWIPRVPAFALQESYSFTSAACFAWIQLSSRLRWIESNVPIQMLAKPSRTRLFQLPQPRETVPAKIGTHTQVQQEAGIIFPSTQEPFPECLDIQKIGGPLVFGLPKDKAIETKQLHKINNNNASYLITLHAAVLGMSQSR